MPWWIASQVAACILRRRTVGKVVARTSQRCTFLFGYHLPFWFFAWDQTEVSVSTLDGSHLSILRTCQFSWLPRLLTILIAFDSILRRITNPTEKTRPAASKLLEGEELKKQSVRSADLSQFSLTPQDWIDLGHRCVTDVDSVYTPTSNQLPFHQILDVKMSQCHTIFINGGNV